jgi:hypothetical protein
MGRGDPDRRPGAAQSGQATVEWVALVLLVALVLGGVLAAAGLMRVTLALPGELAERFVCAASLRDGCGEGDPVVAEAYGDEIADLTRAYAPTLVYETGMRALPVDYRRCREDACAEGPKEGDATHSNEGEPVVAFTHAVDCRPDAAAATEASGADCSGQRTGNLYLQYWFYYPGSATAEGSSPLRKPIRDASTALGTPTYHPDDWESFQVRVGPDGRRHARASSHHGYVYDAGGPGLIPGYVSRPAPGGGVLIERRPVTVNDWGPDTGVVYVAGGSHAGRAGVPQASARSTRSRRVQLVPIRGVADTDRTRFAVVPPWRKKVFFDPESPETD